MMLLLLDGGRVCVGPRPQGADGGEEDEEGKEEKRREEVRSQEEGGWGWARGGEVVLWFGGKGVCARHDAWGVRERACR